MPADASPRTDRGSGTLLGVIIGVVSGGVAIGVAQFVAGLGDPQASPIITVGQTLIDATPEWLKSFAIRAFGQNDKLVLLAGMGLVLVLVSMALGIAAVGRLWVGLAGLAAFGALGVAAALSRPGATAADALPAVAGAVAGGLTLLLLRRVGGAVPRPSAREAMRQAHSAVEPAARTIGRRGFLLAAAGGAAVAVAAGGVGNLLARRFRADASRAGVLIPEPSSPAAVAGSELSVPGLSPFYTPNGSFYRVDTALLAPAVQADEWRLRIHGMVDREVTLDYEQLLARPLIERDITLACVSNPVGGRYIGNARWIGAPLKDLLKEAGVRIGADQIVTRSIDGFTVGTPTAVAMDGRDAMLAVSMNGEPLPLEHGFPVRMIVPGLYGYVSATKWVIDMELTTFDAFDPYWIQRGWAEQAPVKTMSRIDTPVSFAQVPAGAVPVAGVAWAQHRGIGRVEVQVDDGPWAAAELAGDDTIDTWRQWVFRWEATPGEHQVRARATDRTGSTQPPDLVEPFPDGATGWHTVTVRVA